MTYKITIGDQTFDIQIDALTGRTAQVTVDGVPYEARIEEQPGTSAPAPVTPAPATLFPAAAPARPDAGGTAAGTLQAPIPGMITAILVKVGDAVSAGQVVATMEAMKMENNLVSRAAGKVREIRVQKGAEVATGDVIMVIG